MSRIPLTLASLLLIASSIGVNIARYPQVGHTVDSGSRTDPAKVEEPFPATNPADSLETEKPSQGAVAARPENTKVQSETAARSVEDKAPSDRSPAAGQAISSLQSAVTILDVRPMIPVATLRAARRRHNYPSATRRFGDSRPSIRVFRRSDNISLPPSIEPSRILRRQRRRQNHRADESKNANPPKDQCPFRRDLGFSFVTDSIRVM